MSIGGIAGENSGYGTITNCYYNKSVYSGNLIGTNEGTVDAFSSGKTTTQFKSGEVAYLLQGEQTSAVWGQTLGVDDNPVMGGEKVYYSSELNVYTNYELSKKNSDGFYEISNAKQLVGFAEYYNAGKIASPANAVLTANINLEGYSWIPIGNASTKYKGVFDGQGHTISNFNMTITGAGNWGLFGYATGEGTVIKNLSISGNVTTALTSNVDVQYGVVGQADGTAEIRNMHSSVNLTSNDTYQKKYFGGIVGRTGNITVDMCSYSGTLSLGSNTLDCVGGVVGYVYNGKTAKITNCSFSGKIESTYTDGKIGGILGYYNGENAKALTLSNCLSVGTLPEGRNAFVGTIKNYGSTNAGSNNYYTDGMTHSVSNVTAAAATKIQLKSGEIAIALGDAWGQNVNNGVLNQGYPVVGGATVYCVTNCLGNADYSNTNAVRHASGCVLYNGAYSLCGEFGSNGIVDGVYHISTAEQLVSFAKTVNNGNTEIDAKLINNIDLTGYEWTPIGTAENMYGGLFDGNGKSITVQFSYFGGYEDEKGNYSLFGFINNTDIQDLTVKGSIAVRGAYATGLVSQVHGNCIIIRCLTDVDITTLGIMAYASGLVGKVDGCLNIIHCGFTGSMTNPEQTFNSSGLVSDAQNTAEVFIANSFVAADFSDYTQLSFDSGDTFIKGGGIVNMIDCYYLESLNGTPAYATQKTAEQFASGEVAYILQSKALEQTWGQDSNQPGSTPILDSTGIYKVVKVGETGNYSVANVGDTNGDGTVDVTDYQALVNTILADDHEQIETASYDDIIRYDIDGDGYIDVIDASFMHLFINGFVTVDVYAVGDYDTNGIAFEEADIKAIKHAIENPEKLATYKKYASDINGDGKLDENDLTALTAKYGEVTGTECADNVKVYYRWGDNYSTCTATAICTLCNKKVVTETVDTSSNTIAELTCEEDGKVIYTAVFQNELLGTKINEVVTKAKGHNFNEAGECECGLKKLQINSFNVADDYPLTQGWSDEAIGTESSGKTSWIDGDEILVSFTTESNGTKAFTLEYRDGNWTSNIDALTYYSDEAPEFSVVYAPCYNASENSIVLEEGMQPGMGEYMIAEPQLDGELLNIEFFDIPTYSRLRIAGQPETTYTVDVTGFIPAGGAYGEYSYTLTTDSDGNAFLYGVFTENAVITVKTADGIDVVAEHIFSREEYPYGTTAGESYVLDARPGYEYDEATNTYFVYNAKGLFSVANTVNSGATDINITLTDNIVVNENVLNDDGTLNGNGSNFRTWTPIGNGNNRYIGTFDGAGYTISGLYFNNSDANYIGLIGYLNQGGIVKNVGVADSYINGDDYVGGIVGRSAGTVTNSYNASSVNGIERVGGIVGHAAEGSIYKCYNTGVVKGSYNFAGGVAGENDGTINQCYNTGAVSGYYIAGGVVGENNAEINNCYNTGDVSSTSKNAKVGGVAGRNIIDGTVTNSYSTGGIVATGSEASAGGVVGYMYSGLLSNCYFNKTKYSGYSCGGENSSCTITNTSGKTTTEFAAEKMAALLNGSQTDAPWEYIEGNASPTLKAFNQQIANS